jgi:hypothetical protein
MMTIHAMTGLANDIREVQAPILAGMLIGACAAKLRRVLRSGSLDAGLGPTELFPLPLRRPAALTVCAIEFAVGVAMIVTAPAAARNGTGAMDGAAADGARIAATAFFLVAMCALIELRGRRPDAGCGCFGDLSTRPVGARSIARSALLAVAALASIGGPGLHLPPLGHGAAALLAILCTEFLVIALLSPEVGEALIRLGYSEPCELRSISALGTLYALQRSPHWQRQAGVVTSDVPTDMWRELCWRYVVYSGRLDGADVDVVFAVQVKQRHPLIHSAVVPRETPASATAQAEEATAQAEGAAAQVKKAAAQAEGATLPPGVERVSAMPISKAL